MESGKNINAVTDINGFYTIDLPSGENILTLKALGIEELNKKVIIFSDGTLNFDLVENPELLEEVFIEADKDKINVSLDELEENLDTAAIDPHLYAAIKAKDFKLAIRLYYLMIIQKLALKEKIIWKKHKTNKHYLNEMRSKEEYHTFKILTLIYEKCWFGEEDVTEATYNTINPDFVNFLQNIK